MAENEFEEYVKTRKTYCPNCGDPISDHAVWEIGNCDHRKHLNNIFKDANRGREEEGV